MIEKFIASKIENSIEKLKSNLEKEIEINSLEINEVFFNNIYFENDIRKSEQLKETFEQLKLIKNPVLYWFEIDTTRINAEKIRNIYNEHLAKKSDRAISSYKKDYDRNSKTLYVGKVKTGFWGRLITHLGYHTSKKTAGLQLFHWYNIGESISPLKLNYIIFGREMEDLISVLELELARKLKPILGRY